MNRLIAMVYSYVLWLLLTLAYDWQHLAAGAGVSILVGLVFGGRFIEEPAKVFQPRRWFWFLVYIPVFTWEMTKANFDVAYRVLHPKMPIKPGIVKIRTKIRSDMGRVFLANSITLTPGTFTVDLKDDVMYIHCIYVRHTDIEKASEWIVKPFEGLLMKIFD